MKTILLFLIISIGVCQEIPCSEEPSTYENSQIEFCWLNDTYSHLGQVFVKGTGVHFDEDGNLDWVFLPNDMEVQGIGCRGGGHSFMTGFHPNGKLRLGWLIDDQVIQGIPCAKFNFFKAIFAGIHGKSGGTYFWDNGQLKQCELSKDFSIKGQLLKKGTILKFDKEGNTIQ